MGFDSAVVRVHPLSDVRQRLSEIVARFRGEGATAEPVVFGVHRKPEAVVLPFDAYEALLDSNRRLQAALESARSVQVELPGAFSPDHESAVAAYVSGEIDSDEVYERTLARYRKK